MTSGQRVAVFAMREMAMQISTWALTYAQKGQRQYELGVECIRPADLSTIQNGRFVEVHMQRVAVSNHATCSIRVLKHTAWRLARKRGPRCILTVFLSRGPYLEPSINVR